jgi:hypothetical protein
MAASKVSQIPHNLPKSLQKIHHIRIRRDINFNGLPFRYYHHGLLFEPKNDEPFIIHYSGEPNSQSTNASVCKTNWNGFLKGGRIENVEYYDELEKQMGLQKAEVDIIAERAYSRFGESQYSLIDNNCEHFTNYCLYGISFSKQVDQVAMMFQGLQGLFGRK